ncbi:MAG: Hint domain-containing protein [Pseudomonadota bacterium]
MDRSLSAAVARSADIFSQEIRRGPLNPKKRPVTPATTTRAFRDYHISYLGADGKVHDATRGARAHPTFEAAFSALTHGAIVQTRKGVMSVEDLMPGDELRLADGHYDTLLWHGSIAIKPGGRAAHALTRITADAMGFNRPAPDLVLGPSARLLHRAGGVRKLTGCDAAFIPAADFIDGISVLALAPTAPMMVYQLGFARQCSLNVNGLEIETLHPGTAFELGLRGDMLADYLSLFPHKATYEDFGIMRYPRLNRKDLELLG